MLLQKKKTQTEKVVSAPGESITSNTRRFTPKCLQFFCSPPTENTFAGWSRMLPFTYRYIYNMHKCNTHTHMAVAFYSETQWMYKVILRSSRWCRSRSTVTQYITILSVLHVVHAGVNGHMISVQSPWKHYCINIPAVFFKFCLKRSELINVYLTR